MTRDDKFVAAFWVVSIDKPTNPDKKPTNPVVNIQNWLPILDCWKNGPQSAMKKAATSERLTPIN